MATTRLKTLNHYPEFRTNPGIDSIILFLQTLALPPGLNVRQTTRWLEKFDPATSGFVVRHGNELFYNPPNQNIDLEVVRPQHRQARIQLIYDDIRRGLGVGLTAFYHQVCMSYLGISKALTTEFLNRQGDVQVGRVPINKIVNRPIVPETCNSIYGMDIIDMTNYPAIGNQNMQYILTVVDYFSGKCWARGIPNRLNNAVNHTLSDAFEDICTNETHTWPLSLICDSEFAIGHMRFFLNSHHIQIRKASSYFPHSVGKIESLNKIVRTKIKAYLVRTNAVIWHPRLQDFIANINSQQQSTTGRTRDQIWTPGHPVVPNNAMLPYRPLNDQYTPAELQHYMERYHNERAAHLVGLTHTNNHVYHVGDMCRIKLTKISNVMRRLRETHWGINRVALHFSPLRVMIHSVVPATRTRRVAYTLSHNGYVMLQGGVPKLWFSSELTPSPNIGAVETHVFPQDIPRSLFINRLP